MQGLPIPPCPRRDPPHPRRPRPRTPLAARRSCLGAASRAAGRAAETGGARARCGRDLFEGWEERVEAVGSALLVLLCTALALCLPSALTDRFDHVAWIHWLAPSRLPTPTLSVRPPARHVGKAHRLARCRRPVARPPCRRRLALGHSSDPAATANTALLLFPRLALLKTSPCALLFFENGFCRARD